MRGSSARSRVLVALWAVCACDEVGGEAEVVVAVATPAIEGVVPALATAPPPPTQGGLNATLTATQGPPAVPEEEEEAAKPGRLETERGDALWSLGPPVR